MARALEDVAAELYALPPAEFTARRSELAKALRTEDKQLSEAVARLPKPVVSAWAVNHYARERADELDDLLALGEQLREAQSELAGDRMRALASNATALVQRTLKGVAHLADDAGTPLSDALRAQVEQTLRAALADEDAASAICAGLLVKPLEPGGFGSVDLTGAVALVPAQKPVRTTRRRLSAVRPAEDRRKEQARRAAETALAELERAEADVATRDEVAKEAALEHRHAAQRRDELRHELEAAEQETRTAGERLRTAEREHESAARAAVKATAVAQRAQRALDTIS